MKSSTKIIALVIVGVLAVGTIYLWTADIPAPSKEVNKTLSDDRFE